MGPAPKRRTAISLTGAFLTLLAGMVVAPTTAQAGCGYHAVPKAERTAASVNKLQILSDLPVVAPSAEAATEEHRGCPCSGPTCSENPGRPDAPPTSPFPPSLDRWCDTTAAFALAGPGTADGVADDPSLHALILPSTLERPPRIVPPRSHV